jgi:hypothetical protein
VSLTFHSALRKLNNNEHLTIHVFTKIDTLEINETTKFYKLQMKLRNVTSSWKSKIVFNLQSYADSDSTLGKCIMSMTDPLMRCSLLFEFVILILTHNFSCYICLAWCTKFPGLTIPTETMKIGIQWITRGSVGWASWLPQAILVLDWSISKNLLLWNCNAKMNRNLVGSIYGRFCIKFPQSKMKGERHRLSGQPIEPLVL